MIRPWATRSDVAAAVKAIAGIYEKEGALPLDLAEAYWRILHDVTKERPELAGTFIGSLREACPQALALIQGDGPL